MNNTRLRFPALLVILLAPAAAAVAQEAPAASNTVESVRTVQILWDAEAPPPDIGGVLARLFGKEIAADLGKRILGVEGPAAARVAAQYGRLELTDRSCTFSFRAGPVPRPASKEYADALVERLASLLAEDRQKQASMRLDRARQEMQELEAHLDDTRLRAREKQAKLLQVAGRSDLSPATLIASIGKLEDDRERFELELAGMQARLEAVQEQIAEATAAAKKQAAEDPVIAELEKAVAARQNLLELARKRFEAGLLQPHEMAAAEAELAEARVQLLDRRGLASARGGGDVAPLTRELQTLAIDIRDRKARLAHVAKRIEPLRGVADEFQELEWLQDEATQTRRAVEQAGRELREAQSALQAAPVDRVIVTVARDRMAGEEPGT